MRRLALITAATVLGVTATTATAVAGPGHQQPKPLRILLTNDDGFDAPGINAVRDALVRAGNDVTVVAPLGNQSGTGGKLTFGGAVQVTHPDAKTYAVNGSPADSVEVGLSVVFGDHAPDLVVSGTNAGQNIGAATIHSGTVGAAVTAIEDGVPAIAVSTELTATAQPYAATGTFVAQLVAQLHEQSRGKRLLPLGSGLNVNYPVVEDGSTPKPVLTQTGRGFLDVGYTGALPAVGASSSLAVVPDLTVPEPVRSADTTALAANRIAVSVIEGDYDADDFGARATAAKALHGLGERGQ